MTIDDMNIKDAISWIRCDFDKINLLMARKCLILLADEIERLQGVEDCVTTLRIRNTAFKRKIEAIEAELLLSDREQNKLNDEIELLRSRGATI
jgi:hypothetical protein